MSFRKSTDLNPNIAVQNQQTTHLDISNSLLPNTVKDGSGIYYSPLLDSDGRLLVSNDTSHGTKIITLFDSAYYNVAGTYQSSSADCRTSTGNLTLTGSITGGIVGQKVVIRSSHDNINFQELHSLNIPIVEDGTSSFFTVNFLCAMSYIQLQYKNSDIIPRTINSKLSFKH